MTGIVEPGLSAATVHRAAKRTLDVVGSACALLVLGPLMLAIALAIHRSDPTAPALFRQTRCGRGGRPIEILKFRTMVADADTRKEALRHLSVVPWPDFQLPDDPRVTPLGRFLRRTSLDELPQFVNVLRGEMSLVGPRPTSFDATTYALWQTERLEHRPGITGPWQVHGRRGMDFESRCRLEISFFRRPSLARELWLVVQTLGVVIRRTGTA